MGCISIWFVLFVRKTNRAHRSDSPTPGSDSIRQSDTSDSPTVRQSDSVRQRPTAVRQCDAADTRSRKSVSVCQCPTVPTDVRQSDSSDNYRTVPVLCGAQWCWWVDRMECECQCLVSLRNVHPYPVSSLAARALTGDQSLPVPRFTQQAKMFMMVPEAHLLICCSSGTLDGWSIKV